ncbi:LicD family protein [bacterium]|nr:LicD family protein [bacterium]
MNHWVQEAIYHWLVFLRKIRYSRWLAGPQHRHLARAELRRFYVGLNGFLQSLEVDYWLAYGTLLGFHRDSDLILGDADIDFGLRVEDYQKVLDYQHRLPPGYQLIDTSHKHGGPKLYVRCGLFAADLYFYCSQGEHLHIYLNSHYVSDRTPVARHLIQPTQPAHFLGQPTRIPNCSEELLLWTYGYLGSDGRLDPETGFWHPPQKQSPP